MCISSQCRPTSMGCAGPFEPFTVTIPDISTRGSARPAICGKGGSAAWQWTRRIFTLRSAMSRSTRFAHGWCHEQSIGASRAFRHILQAKMIVSSGSDRLSIELAISRCFWAKISTRPLPMPPCGRQKRSAGRSDRRNGWRTWKNDRACRSSRKSGGRDLRQR